MEPFRFGTSRDLKTLRKANLHALHRHPGIEPDFRFDPTLVFAERAGRQYRLNNLQRQVSDDSTPEDSFRDYASAHGADQVKLDGEGSDSIESIEDGGDLEVDRYTSDEIGLVIPEEEHDSAATVSDTESYSQESEQDYIEESYNSEEYSGEEDSITSPDTHVKGTGTDQHLGTQYYQPGISQDTHLGKREDKEDFADHPYHQALLQHIDTLADTFFRSITISDDQSAGSGSEKRRLLALQERKLEPDFTPEYVNIPRRTGNHALADYQMQLMLLEQQNKKRLMMAVQEQLQHASEAKELMYETTQHAQMSEISQTNDNQNSNNAEGSGDLGKILQGLDNPALDLKKLQDYINLLQAKAQDFEKLKSRQIRSRYQILYRIKQPNYSRRGQVETIVSGPFIDAPQWVGNSKASGRVQSHSPVSNFDLFLEKAQDLAFIVFRDFDVAQDAQTQSMEAEDSASKLILEAPKHAAESIMPVSKDLQEAIKQFLSSDSRYSDLSQLFSSKSELQAPYLFMYHGRQVLNETMKDASHSIQQQWNLLLDYISECYGEEYNNADLFKQQGKVSPRYIQYLYKPGDVLVIRNGLDHRGYVATDWPKFDGIVKHSQVSEANKLKAYDSAGTLKPSTKGHRRTCEWTIKVWNWEFDGSFARKDSQHVLRFPLDEHQETTNAASKGKDPTVSHDPNVFTRPTDISSLNIFPLEHATEDIKELLRKRGRIFWRCRKKQLVTYQKSESDPTSSLSTERYMIDLKTFRELHRETFRATVELPDQIGPDLLARDEPPDSLFEYLLPLKIKGYNLQRKKWFDLAADRIVDVQWNKESFQHLVIDHKARDLIRALVSNQLESEKSTDLISGKGNGLILLLHGGPGTGKTLTAESVAEIAEKPLYRVTCGDVGTKAEIVEKYLESVLHLGKIWDCVVLLDEADVFLEQRSLEDLKRNALVSVFLRILEYYEGILILTSNRVGTFDEAFKSRIQLALHYPNLGPYQRLRIWENFITRLETVDSSRIEIQDLRNHLEELKDYELNGREIRNIITTARQYAKWQCKTMNYAHVKDVIEVSTRFDRYLEKLNNGLTQDQLAGDEGLR